MQRIFDSHKFSTVKVQGWIDLRCRHGENKGNRARDRCCLAVARGYLRGDEGRNGLQLQKTGPRVSHETSTRSFSRLRKKCQAVGKFCVADTVLQCWFFVL